MEKGKPVKEQVQAPSQTKSYFSIEYWQTYFEINQYELLDRLKILTDPKQLVIFEEIKKKPELYGPFWIATSLIFCLFIFGNLSATGQQSSYDYEILSKAVTAIYGYCLFIPVLHYFVMKFYNVQGDYFMVD